MPVPSLRHLLICLLLLGQLCRALALDQSQRATPITELRDHYDVVITRAALSTGGRAKSKFYQYLYLLIGGVVSFIALIACWVGW